MSKMIDNLKEKIKEMEESGEFEKIAEEFAKKLEKRDNSLERNFKRIQEHLNTSEKFSEFVEKVIEKYSSDSYIDKEYKLGYQPREDLLFLLFEFARKYGREATEIEEESFGLAFLGGLYIYDDYMFGILHGQGSIIRVQKVSGLEYVKSLVVTQEDIGGPTIRDNETYSVIDNSALKNLTVSKTILHKGKCTSGHSHEGSEEVYQFISGKGEIQLDDDFYDVKAGSIVLIEDGVFHKVFNKGMEDLVFICVFQKYNGRD